LAVRKSVIIVTLDGIKIVLSMGREYPTGLKIVGRKFKFNMGVPSPRGSARY
jgi:hypothetical protein